MTKELPVRLDSNIVYENNYMKVVKDSLGYPGGQKREYIYIQKPDTAIIIAEEDSLFYLVREFRYPSKRYFVQFPLESKENGESFLDCAKRGLMEEVGFRAENWLLLGSFFTDPGISAQVCQVFLASELSKVEEVRAYDPTEDIEVIPLSRNKINEIIDNNEAEGWTIAAWSLYERQKTSQA
jgi:ADP-ribose pyrophosphatase